MALTALHDIRLVPVLELEPYRFASAERSEAFDLYRSQPNGMVRYWTDCLADSGLVDLPPLWPGSWHVPTASLTDPVLIQRLLSIVVEAWGGPESLTDPDSRCVLRGGIALFEAADVLAAPQCCVDLSNLSDWRQAMACQNEAWETLWIGHPWMSIRYEAGLLILSQPHESTSPSDDWAVTPDDLRRAVQLAETEMEAFAERLRPTVATLVGHEASGLAARCLAGLGE